MDTTQCNDSITYLILGSHADSFPINSSTGQIQTATTFTSSQGGTTKTFIITATDNAPHPATSAATIHIAIDAVPTTPEHQLLARYDTNNNGMMDKPEVIQAINDYLFDQSDEPITKAEVTSLIDLYKSRI